MPGGCGRSRTPPHPDVEVPGRLQGQDGEGQALDGTDLELMSPPTASKGKSNTIGIAPGGNACICGAVAGHFPFGSLPFTRGCYETRAANPAATRRGESPPPLPPVSWPAEELALNCLEVEHPVRSWGEICEAKTTGGRLPGLRRPGARGGATPPVLFCPIPPRECDRATPACTPTSKGQAKGLLNLTGMSPGGAHTVTGSPGVWRR